MVYTKATLGIFQGGGVKVSAFSGAIQCAIEEGYEFSCVSGTSGGAIVATLIAAGFSHTQIKDILARVDFNSFLVKPEKHPNINQKAYKFPIKLFNSFIKKSRVVNYLGMYSSSHIQEWLNKQLKKQLSVSDTYVTFNDLKIPLVVVATDLVNGKYKVWSTFTTPDVPVAYAVRASCSIPLFFQPILDDTSVYVDGGVISNLPITISINILRDNVKNIENIIGFHLYNASNHSPKFPWGLRDFIKRMAHAITNGNVELQKLASPQYINLIPISIDFVKSEDFDLMTNEMKEKLYVEGYEQTKKILGTGYLREVEKNTGNIIFYQHDYFSKLQDFLTNAKDEIIFSINDLDWVFEIVMSIIYARTKGVEISILYNGDNLPSRHNFLTALGCKFCHLDEKDRVDYSCVIKDPKRKSSCSIILLNSDTAIDGVFASYYDKPFHYEIIQRFYRNLNSKLYKLKAIVGYHPVLVKVSEEELIKELRKVKFYSGRDVEIQMKKVEISDVIPHQNHIRRYKLNQVKSTKALFNEHTFDLYEPIGVKLKNGKISLIIPPVLELKKDGLLHAAEGHTRIFDARRSKILNLNCVIIKNVDSPLPAKAESWASLEIIDKNISNEDIYRENDANLTRWIDSATHGLKDWTT